MLHVLMVDPSQLRFGSPESILRSMFSLMVLAVTLEPAEPVIVTSTDQSTDVLVVARDAADSAHIRALLPTLNVAEADARACFDVVGQQRPALVLIGLAGDDSVTLLDQLAGCYPPPVVLMILDHDDPERIRQCFARGAADYVTRASLDVTLDPRVRRLLDAAQQERRVETLTANERLFREVADTAPVMIWMGDPDGYCTYVNHLWLTFTGRSFDQETRHGWVDTVHPDDLDDYWTVYHTAVGSAESFTTAYRLLRADGEYRWILDSTTARFDEHGTFIGFIGACTDITEQKQAEDALKHANHSFHTLINAAPLAITAFDLSGVVQLWNPAAERIFGYRAEEVLGKPHPIRLVNSTHVEPFQQVVQGVSIMDMEVEVQRRDGYLVHVSASVAPRYSMAGAIDGVIAVTADITERKRVEAAAREQRILAEALRDAGAALAGSLDPQTVMHLILELVGRVVPHDAVNIMQLEGDIARVMHTRGYPDWLDDQLMGAAFSLTLPHIRSMLETSQPRLINDSATDPNWVPSFEQNWIRANLGTPIRVYGSVIGFLNLDSHTPNAFKPEHIERLQAFANQVAIAIENAQLYDALRREAANLRMLHRATSFLFEHNLFSFSTLEEIGSKISEAVVKEFAQLDCGVMLVDSQQSHLIRLARAGQMNVDATKPLHKDGAGLVPEAVRTGEVIYAPDVRNDPRYVSSDERTRSELVIPLITSKGVIGVLDLQSMAVDAFSAHDQRILVGFAERAAAAIENMLLYEEVRRYTLDLEQRVSERTVELHRVKERVEAILNNSSDAILMTRADGVIQQTNRAFNQLFSYRIDEMFGKPLTTLIIPEYADTLRNTLHNVVATGRAARLELAACTAHGAIFEADIMIAPVVERDSRVTTLVCSLRDITDRKRVERELRRALEREKELSDLKSRFISTASHEFRTPLSMIMTSSDLLKNYGSRLNEAQKAERLDKIQLEVKNITALLDDLLTIGRADRIDNLEFNPVAVDLRAACEQIVHEVETGIGANHQLVFEHSGDFQLAVLDPKLLRRFLFNLLSNAVKYSLPDTKISITLICEKARKIIKVQDHGMGIPVDDQRHMFEAFHRAKNVGDISGTGLGLAIVKQAVDLHNGTITVTSDVGIGTTFIVTIPESGLKEDGQ